MLQSAEIIYSHSSLIEKNKGRLFWTEIRLNDRTAGSWGPDSFMQIRQQIFSKCQSDFLAFIGRSSEICNVAIQQMEKRQMSMKVIFPTSSSGNTSVPESQKRNLHSACCPQLLQKKACQIAHLTTSICPDFFSIYKHYSCLSLYPVLAVDFLSVVTSVFESFF